MITWPVALTRAFLTTVVVWGAGVGLTLAAFALADADTIVHGAEGRAHTQVIWFGSHAFFACIGPLLGLMVGGGAAVEAFLAGPSTAIARVGLPLLAGSWAVVGVLLARGDIRSTMAVATAVGAFIGVGCGAAYLLLRGTPRDDRMIGRPAGPVSRGWGSR